MDNKQKDFQITQGENGGKSQPEGEKLLAFCFALWMWAITLLYYSGTIGDNFTRISGSFQKALSTYFLR